MRARLGAGRQHLELLFFPLSSAAPLRKAAHTLSCVSTLSTQHYTTQHANDAGTENERLRERDPLYLGLQQRRVRGDAYYALIDELALALRQRFGPNTLIHWEDLAPAQGFGALARLRAAGAATFNDDIECTAAVAAAALLGALRLAPLAGPAGPAAGGAGGGSGSSSASASSSSAASSPAAAAAAAAAATAVPLTTQRFLFFGAGQASLGIARLLVRLLQRRGVPEFKARASIWLVDRGGLVTTARKDLTPEKAQFAQVRGRQGVGGETSRQKGEAFCSCDAARRRGLTRPMQTTLRPSPSQLRTPAAACRSSSRARAPAARGGGARRRWC